MFASVIVDVPSKSVNQVFDYRIPEGMQDIVKVGHRVLVPFGRRTIQGYVMNIKDSADFDPSKIKPITSTLDIEPVLTEEMIVIAKYLAEYYVDQYISVIETILPAALTAKSCSILPRTAADSDAERAFSSLGMSNEVEAGRLTAEQLSVLRALLKSGALAEETVISQHTRKKTALGV